MEQETTGFPVDADANAFAEGTFEESMLDATEDVSSDRASRYYDRIRRSIHDYLETKGKLAGKTGELLLLVPDIFMLMWRLATDGRVDGKNKLLLGSGVAYFLFPLDIMPEGLLGPAGYADDLVLAVFILNKMISDVSLDVIREHWSGSEDVLESIRKVLTAADGLVGSDLLNRIKKMMK